MSRVSFEYHLRDDFVTSVTDHYYTLKCCPFDTSRQKILSLEVKISPYDNMSKSADAFGNIIFTGHILVPHKYFEVKISGYADTGLAVYEARQEQVHLLYGFASGYTSPGKNLKEYSAKLRLDKLNNNYDKVLWITQNLYDYYSYQKNVTDINTKAEEAFQLKKGVCQDYAHILLALCRMAGIPCRYVVGILIGEGESHAWVEFFSKGYWYGIDPTNNLLVNDSYLRISSGRDYHDCIISRGIYKGAPDSKQYIHAQMTKITD
ncbi:MAG: transglutaminase domain-containing protein [Lachnospiraceae bacterium]